MSRVVMGVRLARDRTDNGSFVRAAALEEDIEHARVSCPLAQHTACVAGLGLAQRPQQIGDGARIVNAGVLDSLPLLREAICSPIGSRKLNPKTCLTSRDGEILTRDPLTPSHERPVWPGRTESAGGASHLR